MQPYKWTIKVGPLVIRPNKNAAKHPHIISYYWKGNYFLTSARRYVIVRIGKYSHIFACWHGFKYQKTEYRKHETA